MSTSDTQAHGTRTRDFVTWHEPSGAWFSTSLIVFGAVALAYLPLSHAIFGSGAGAARTITFVAIAVVVLISGVVVAIYPRPRPTHVGYVRRTAARCVRGGICGVTLGWSILSFVDASAFGVAPFDSAWLTALTQRAGLVIAAVLWDPGQQRILRAWWQTVKGYSMSDTGAAQ